MGWGNPWFGGAAAYNQKPIVNIKTNTNVANFNSRVKGRTEKVIPQPESETLCANGATYKTGDTKEIPFGSVIEINGSRILTGL